MSAVHALPSADGATGASPHEALARAMPGRSEAMTRVRSVLMGCLSASEPVLISGEAGSGKAHTARLIHELDRTGAPFVVLTASDDPVEGFGRAGSGSVFLDEVGEFPAGAQADVLRRIRGEPVSGGPRVLAGTSHNLADMVRQERFRPDLFHRLDVFRLSLPPLRERLEDIPQLCRAWLGKERIDTSWPDDAAIGWLAGQAWPGNLTQLRNLVHRVMVQGRETWMERAVLEKAYAETGAATDPLTQPLTLVLERYLTPFLQDAGAGLEGLHARVMAEVERPLFRLVLEATSGNQLKAAAMLGLNRNTLRKKLRQLGVETTRP